MSILKKLYISLLLFFLFPFYSNSQKLELPLLWTTNQQTFLESAATVADINGDGRDEILIAGREEFIGSNTCTYTCLLGLEVISCRIMVWK